MATPAARLGAFVADVRFDDLPDGAAATVTRAFLDTICVTLAGTESRAGRAAATVGDHSAPAADIGALLGVAGDDPPAETALRVGTAAHALDYDDMAWAMDGHPSVTLVPALLATVPDVRPSGLELITAYAAGFETACAVAAPVSPAHYEAGWHATATFGTFGATAAVAHLLDLDAETTAQAQRIAASMPAGLKRNFGSPTKPLHAGLAARSGGTAARFAAGGGSADPTAISGDRGFWDLYCPEEREAFSIGDRWELAASGIDVKAYPCCYFTHAAVAATQSLTDDLDPADIDEIEVQVSAGATDACEHTDPADGLEAKFSLEYAVASAAVRDRVGLDAFRDAAVDDPAVQRLRERVTVSVDETLPYDAHEAHVRIETAEGTVERHQADPPWTHGDPPSAAALRGKFDECAGAVLDDDQVDALYQTLTSLSTVEDVAAALADVP